MNRFEGIRPSVGKIVLCSILAFVVGLLQPLTTVFQLMLPAPAVSLAMIAAAAFYGSGGIVPAAVFGTAAVFSSVLVYGITAGMLSVLVWLAPAVVIMMGMRKRSAFSAQLTKGIAAAVVAVLAAAAGMAAVYGVDLIEQFLKQVRQNFSAQQELLWQVTAPIFSAEMSLEQFTELYYTAFNTLQIYYEYYLVANLICGAIGSACIAVLWGNWKLAKRGLATAESYRSLNRWRIPANTTWGLLMMLAAAFIVAKTELEAAQVALCIVSELCQLVFVIQFMGALERRMRRGSGYKMRVVMLILLLIMGYTSGMVRTMAILGGISALFGSEGAAKPLIDKIKNNNDGNNR